MMPWWGYVAAYFAAGVVFVCVAWRFGLEFEDGELPLALILAAVTWWPFGIFFAVISWLGNTSVPSYSVYAERRREREERRARPSEVAPSSRREVRR